MATLREAALVAVNDVNTRGVLLEDRLWAMPARVRTVALSRVRHGTAVTTQVFGEAKNTNFLNFFLQYVKHVDARSN